MAETFPLAKMDLEAVWTDKFEDRLRQSIIECVAYTNLDLLTWHPTYVEANKISSKICKSYCGIPKHEIELFVWKKLELIQKWVLEEKEKNPTQNWKMILGSKKSGYIKKLELFTANPEDLPNSIIKEVYGKIKDFFGKVISLTRQLDNPTGVNHKIMLFHCINLFSHLQLGLTTTHIWESFLDLSGQISLGSKDFGNLQTITDLISFLEGNKCLFCNESGSEDSSAPVKFIGDHVKNCHSFKTIPCSFAECNALLTTKKKLSSHLKKFHKVEHLYQCEECQTSFTSKLDLTLHENRVHNKRKRIRRQNYQQDEPTTDDEDEDESNDENEMPDQQTRSHNENLNLEELSKDEIMSRFKNAVAENQALRDENLKLQSKLTRKNSDQDASTQTEVQVISVDVLNFVPQVVVNDVVPYQAIYPIERFSVEAGFQTATNGESVAVDILDVLGEEQVVAYKKHQPKASPQDSLNNDGRPFQGPQISEEKENQELPKVEFDKSPDKRNSPDKRSLEDENENSKRSSPTEPRMTAFRRRAPFVGIFKKRKTSFC